MAMNLKIAASIAGAYTGQGGLVALSGALNEAASASLTQGTAAGQVDSIYSAQRAIVAGGDDALNLSAGLTDPFGLPLSFSLVKAILLIPLQSNQDDLLVGGGVDPFTGPFGGDGDALRLRPGQIALLACQDANGWSVAAGPMLNFAAATANAAIGYQLVILGCSATLSAPAFAAGPVISGSGIAGQTVKCWPGDISGAPRIAYQWRKNGTSIVGATGAQYMPVQADAGSVLSCTITATNAAGSISATASMPAAVIASIVPLTDLLGEDPSLTAVL